MYDYDCMSMIQTLFYAFYQFYRLNAYKVLWLYEYDLCVLKYNDHILVRKGP